MIRVLLADDQLLIRAGLRAIVDAHSDLEVCGEVGDGLEAVRVVAEGGVDVVLMDLRMPGIDGVEATRRIRAHHPEVRVLVLTTFDQDDNVVHALRAGADGFLGKGAGPLEITDAVRHVGSGGHALSANAVDALVERVLDLGEIGPDGEAAGRLGHLTAREAEVTQLIVDGRSSEQIAEQLTLSPLTVKTHANRAMSKMGARDRGQLVSRAVLAGMRPRR